jgi:hypothetical protein
LSWEWHIAAYGYSGNNFHCSATLTDNQTRATTNLFSNTHYSNENGVVDHMIDNLSPGRNYTIQFSCSGYEATLDFRTGTEDKDADDDFDDNEVKEQVTIVEPKGFKQVETSHEDE